MFNDKDELLLVRRSETAPRRALEWDLPGGFVDPEDRSYQAACLREIAEETDLTVVDDHLDLVYTESAVGELSGVVNDVSWLYFAARATPGEVRLSHEHDDAAWVTLDEARRLITYDTQLRAMEHLRRSRELNAA